MIAYDLAEQDLRGLNRALQGLSEGSNETQWQVLNPQGGHSIAVGLTRPLKVVIEGHAGFYCGGMNKDADIEVHGHVGPGAGENMMSGTLKISGNASQSAGASGHGGLLVIKGDASSRCGISMKGIDIVVGGSIGHFGAFMAQAGHLVVCGDAGANLGDSIYEAILYVQGSVSSLGADCIEKDMTSEHAATLRRLLAASDISADPAAFRRYGSARRLYNFHVDNASTT